MKNIIENHKKAATHLEDAAKLHRESAKHHEEGSHDKAYHSTIKAHGNTAHAVETQKEIIKQHAIKK
jgi:hypothetical protein